MILLATSGALIATLRPSLLTLWFIGSTIRLSVFIPTICSIVNLGTTTRLYTRATQAGLLCGGGIFTLGLTSGDSFTRTVGMIMTVVVPGVTLALGHLSHETSQLARGKMQPRTFEVRSDSSST